MNVLWFLYVNHTGFIKSVPENGGGDMMAQHTSDCRYTLPDEVNSTGVPKISWMNLVPAEPYACNRRLLAIINFLTAW